MEDERIENQDLSEKVDSMSEKEKERAYQRAVDLLGSSLTNDELIEESLSVLKALGDYKHAPTLYETYKALREKKLEESAALDKKRRSSRIMQGIFVAIGCAAILALVVILVVLLKLDIVK